MNDEDEVQVEITVMAYGDDTWLKNDVDFWSYVLNDPEAACQHLLGMDRESIVRDKNMSTESSGELN